MIQIHLNTEDFALAQESGFRPHMQPSSADGVSLSESPWLWHGLRQTIFDREVWLFIEADSQFCVCFFDLKPRDLKQLDLTLWLRFISEQTFMAEKSYFGSQLPIDEKFLTVIRSWMAPMSLQVATSPEIDELAESIFARVRTFLQQPLPCPVPLRYEMEFTWQLNTAHHPSLNQEKVVNTAELHELASKTNTEVVDFPLEGIDLDALQLDDLTMMELIHRQLRSGAQHSLSPALLFTSKIASMIISEPEEWGSLIQFKPKGER